jgi:hypothetical protein
MNVEELNRKIKTLEKDMPLDIAYKGQSAFEKALPIYDIMHPNSR